MHFLPFIGKLIIMSIFRFYNDTSLMVGKQIASPSYIKKLILESRVLLLFCPSFVIVICQIIDSEIQLFQEQFKVIRSN